MTVLVTGATGNAGREVAAALLRRGAPVRAASRDGRPVAGAGAVRLDFADPSTWDAALDGVRGVFLMRPPAMTAMRRTIVPFVARIRAASAAPIVFLSVQGAESSRLVPHRAVEDALAAGPKDWTILRPGFFAQNLCDAYRRDIAEDSRLYLPAGSARVAFVDLRDLAEVAAMALLDPAAHAGRAYALTGQRSVTFAEVAAMLAEALGRPIRYEHASLLGYLRHLRRRGAPLAQALVLARLHWGLRRGEGDRPTPDLPRLLGREPLTIRDTIRDHRALWLR